MNWYSGNIAEAVNLSKTKNAIFVVYVEGTDELSKKLTSLINSENIKKYLESKHFVAIKIQSGSEAYMQFAQIYQLVPLPSLFFIGKNGAPLTVVTGVTQTIEELEEKIKSVVEAAGIKVDFGQSTTTSTGAASASLNFIANEAGSSNSQSNKPNKTIETTIGGTSTEIRQDKHSSDNFVKEEAKDSASVNPEIPKIESESEKKEREKKEKEIEEKLQRAKEIIEKKRKEKEEEEKENERERELRRRKEGQKMVDLKKWQEDQEMKQLKEDRKKEKQQEAEVRKRILKQIEQDRLERIEKFGQVGPQPNRDQEQQHTPVTPPAQRSENNEFARIQFKKPDGESEMHTFNSSDNFQVIREYVEENILPGTGIRQFTLATTFPRKEFTESDNDKKILDLNLAPSAVLLILPIYKSLPVPSSVSSASRGVFDMIYCIVWNIFTPVIGLCAYVKDLIFSRNRDDSSPTNTGAQKRSNEENLSDHDAAKRRNMNLFSSRDSQQPSTSSSGGGTSGRSTGAYRRVGNSNVHRLHESRDSDDENNTWNGNSTQQQ